MYCLGTTPRTVPSRQRHCAIEQAIAHRDRQADNDKLSSPGRGPGDPANRPKAALQQGRLAEQIGTRVARDAELGKQHDVAVGDLVENPDELPTALASGLATEVRIEAQVTRTKPNRFMQPTRRLNRPSLAWVPTARSLRPD